MQEALGGQEHNEVTQLQEAMSRWEHKVNSVAGGTERADKSKLDSSDAWGTEWVQLGELNQWDHWNY